MSFKKYPKVELHLHLDSSVSYDVIKKLSPSITRPEFQRLFVAPKKCLNLPDYLSRVANQVELLQSKPALKLATEELITQLEEDNIIYAEIRFAPILHTLNGLKTKEVVETVNNTIEGYNSSVVVNVILCNVRHFSEEQSMHTVRLVNDFKGSNVLGLDLAGDEKGFPLKNHIKAFQYAKEHDIPVTAHAGEACGPESIKATINELQTKRIGHGVRSFEDPELLEYIKNNNIHLEVCPTSNIQTDVYDTYYDHTVSRLFDEGVSLSINTDGRTTSDVSLTDEYEKLANTFEWDKEHFLQCNLNALDAAFVSEEKKSDLKSIIRKGYN